MWKVVFLRVLGRREGNSENENENERKGQSNSLLSKK
jgi:hypothetical protein